MIEVWILGTLYIAVLLSGVAMVVWEDRKPKFLARSGRWPTLRKKFLEANPECAVCGGKKKLEAHHIKSFEDHPELELDENNLIALCEYDPAQNHHLQAGHLGDFKMINPNVIEDAKCWGEKIAAAKKELANK